jgi:hypothetical protein
MESLETAVATENQLEYLEQLQLIMKKVCKKRNVDLDTIERLLNTGMLVEDMQAGEALYKHSDFRYAVKFSSQSVHRAPRRNTALEALKDSQNDRC